MRNTFLPLTHVTSQVSVLGTFHHLSRGELRRYFKSVDTELLLEVAQEGVGPGSVRPPSQVLVCGDDDVVQARGLASAQTVILTESRLIEALGLGLAASDRLTCLRGALYLDGDSPGPVAWRRCCAVLEAWPTDEVELGLEYVNGQPLPDALRLPPRRWTQRVLSGHDEPRMAVVRHAEFDIAHKGTPLRVLAQATALSRLTELRVRNFFAGPLDLEHFAREAPFDALHLLAFEHAYAEPNDVVAALAQAAHLAALQRLAIPGPPLFTVTAETLAPLWTSPALPALRTVEVAHGRSAEVVVFERPR